jgi:hypothetical protein
LALRWKPGEVKGESAAEGAGIGLRGGFEPGGLELGEDVVVDPGARPGGIFHRRWVEAAKRGEGPGDRLGAFVLGQSGAGEEEEGEEPFEALRESHASTTHWHGGGFQESLPPQRVF